MARLSPPLGCVTRLTLLSFVPLSSPAHSLTFSLFARFLWSGDRKRESLPLRFSNNVKVISAYRTSRTSRRSLEPTSAQVQVQRSNFSPLRVDQVTRIRRNFRFIGSCYERTLYRPREHSSKCLTKNFRRGSLPRKLVRVSYLGCCE